MEFNGTDKRYNQFSAYLKNKFGAKVYKITIDAGFSCPNRDGTISTGGCIFCDESGSFSQAHSNILSIEEQINTGAETLSKRFKAEKFMAYFQAYSNTYKPVDELKQIYDASLNHKDIVGISIGTRPDCVDEEKLKLISSYNKNYYTWLEYGLQSVHNKTLKKINRGHDYETFLNAYKKTKEYGINVCVHVILGLWETHDEMMETAKRLAELKVDGVKIHMLCGIKNVHKHVDNVDNYFPRRCSPMFTTSPAPIVINRSPCAQLFKRKLSISSKVGKYSHGVPSSWICFWRSWEEIPRSSVSRAA